MDNPRNHVLSLWLVYTICNLIVKMVKKYQTMSESPFLSRITINLAVWMVEYIWDLSPRNFGPVFFTGFPFRIVPPLVKAQLVWHLQFLLASHDLKLASWWLNQPVWKDMRKSLRLRFKIADLNTNHQPQSPWGSVAFKWILGGIQCHCPEEIAGLY